MARMELLGFLSLRPNVNKIILMAKFRFFHFLKFHLFDHSNWPNFCPIWPNYHFRSFPVPDGIFIFPVLLHRWILFFLVRPQLRLQRLFPLGKQISSVNFANQNKILSFFDQNFLLNNLDIFGLFLVKNCFFQYFSSHMFSQMRFMAKKWSISPLLANFWPK